ncbi:unnamed protein product [Durusdinium trenchii]|uniref:Calmodulin n=1 Tax=Durusdinium trenchii TaxID=1381693 RepID=A0ABP0K9A8_9DINO
MAPQRHFQYMWGDAGLPFLGTLARMNPMRWSPAMHVSKLVAELEASRERPVRIYMSSEDETLTVDFDASQALPWLRENFAWELTQQPPNEPGFSIFSCTRPQADEPEEMVVEDHANATEEVGAEIAREGDPETTEEVSGVGEKDDCRGLLDENAKVKYMWGDARLLPFQVIQDLSRHNPMRWSSLHSPEALAAKLEEFHEIRPVRISADTQRGSFERSFQSPRAAAQWLRKTFTADMARLDEERLCVICLTEPRNVVLMPCRHAVLCEACLDVLMQSTPSACPVCRRRIQNHARGHFVDDYVELVRAMELRLERSQMAAYEGMYNHIRPLMVTGVLLASGAAACFVVCPPAAPALLAGAGVIGYLPWFATTVANFEGEPLEEQTNRIFTEEDFSSPLRLVTKGVVLLVAAPVALVTFFIPYGIFAGLVRPLCRLGLQGLVRGASASHVYVLRPLARLLAATGRLLWDGAVGSLNLLGDIVGVAAQGFYDLVLAPSWGALSWCGQKMANAAAWIYEHGLVPAGNAVSGAAQAFYNNFLVPCGTATWSGLAAAGNGTYNYVLVPLGQALAKGAEALYALVLVPAGQASLHALKGLGRLVAGTAYGLWSYILLPAAGVTWEGLKFLGRMMALGAEHVYAHGVRPLASFTYNNLLTPMGHAASALASGVAAVLAAAANGLAALASASFTYVLLPCFNAGSTVVVGLAMGLAAATSAGYQYVLVPVASAVGSAAAHVYSYVLVPCGQATLSGCRVVLEAFQQIGHTVRVTIQSLLRAQSVAITPAAKFFRSGLGQDLAPIIAQAFVAHLEEQRPDKWASISTLGKAKLWLQALDLWQEVRSNADLVTFNAAISACGKAQEWQQAEALLQDFPYGDSQQPDLVTWNSLLNAYASATEWPFALQLLADMDAEKTYFGMTLPKPDLFSYNTALNACARAGQWRWSLALFERLREVGLVASEYSCNGLLHGMARARCWQEALQMLRKLLDGGEVVTAAGFSAIMGACERGGLWRQALALLKMLGDGADARALCSAISACEKGLQWQRAIALLESMESWKLPEAYGAACSACEKCSEWQAALAIAAGTVPNLFMCSAAISACAKAGQLKRSVRLLDFMEAADVPPDAATFGAVCAPLVQIEAWSQVLQLFRRMRSSHLTPDAALCADAAALERPQLGQKLQGLLRHSCWTLLVGLQRSSRNSGVVHWRQAELQKELSMVSLATESLLSLDKADDEVGCWQVTSSLSTKRPASHSINQGTQVSSAFRRLPSTWAARHLHQKRPPLPVEWLPNLGSRSTKDLLLDFHLAKPRATVPWAPLARSSALLWWPRGVEATLSAKLVTAWTQSCLDGEELLRCHGHVPPGESRWMNRAVAWQRREAELAGLVAWESEGVAVTCSVTILRAPIFFARLWGWVRHRLTPTMERKVRILGEDFEQGLREHSGLERKALPSFLGGEPRAHQVDQHSAEKCVVPSAILQERLSCDECRRFGLSFGPMSFNEELFDRLDTWLLKAADAVKPQFPHVFEFHEPGTSSALDMVTELPQFQKTASNSDADSNIMAPMSPGSQVDEALRIESTRMQEQRPSAHLTRLGRLLQRGCRAAAVAITNAPVFNVIVALVIVSNSVFLGIQLQVGATQDSREGPAAEHGDAVVFLVGHMIYAVLFTAEMLLRLFATGVRTYLIGKEWYWNWLDLLVVIPAWIELMADLMQTGGGVSSGASNLRILRVLRITRMLQVIRSVRLIRVIHAFRELIFSILDTTRQLVWAMILLVLIIYSFSILFTDAVLQNEHTFKEVPLGELKWEEALFFFGGIFDSYNTTCLAGFDWVEAADALKPLGDFWVQLFHLYVAFCSFAVLNVITGVFVNSAIKTREKDHETVMLHVQKFKDLASNVWQKMDTRGDGKITITEFEQMFDDPDMQAFFESIEINAVDAWTLFDSLDMDGDHLISYEDGLEFVQRCTQLHGNARSVDLFALKQLNGKASGFYVCLLVPLYASETSEIGN